MPRRSGSPTRAMRSRWIRIRSTSAAAQLHRQHLRAAGRARQEARAACRCWRLWKQTSPTVWRFNLRQGVKFHDGTPFTADDVIFSLRAREGRRLGHEDQGRPRSRRSARSTTTRSTSSPTSRSRSCPTRSPPGTSCPRRGARRTTPPRPVDVRKGTENTPATPRQRHRAVHAEVARAGVRTVLVSQPG